MSEVVSYDAEKGVKVDDGSGEQYYVEAFGPPGEDAQPLPGDSVSLVESAGAGEEHALGYDDATEKQAGPGEKRTYSRNAGGEPVAEAWLKSDGTVTFRSLLASNGGVFEIRPDGTVVINGVEFSPTGSVTVPPGAALGNAVLNLIQHTHATAGTGAPSAPIPFPP